MASYKVIIESRAEKELRKLNPDIRKRVVAAIDKLAANPQPSAARKLVGSDGFRLRVGDYRIIYRINGHMLEVYVIGIGHRRQIYRNL